MIPSIKCLEVIKQRLIDAGFATVYMGKVLDEQFDQMPAITIHQTPDGDQTTLQRPQQKRTLHLVLEYWERVSTEDQLYRGLEVQRKIRQSILLENGIDQRETLGGVAVDVNWQNEHTICRERSVITTQCVFTVDYVDKGE